MDGIVPPPKIKNSDVETLTLNVTELGDKAFKGMNKGKWGHKGAILIR